MLDEEEQSKDQQITAQYRKQQNDFNVIKHRTDTTTLLKDFRRFLLGGEIIYTQDRKTGSVKAQFVQEGEPKATMAGINAIMERMTCIINQHTIQCNFPLDAKAHSEAYEQYCYNVEVDFADYLIKNQPEWEISDNHFQGIIDSAVAVIRPVMSRGIGNEERNSYGETSKHIESHSEKPQGRGLFSKL